MDDKTLWNCSLDSFLLPYGLNQDILQKLSWKSRLPMSLKRTLRHFDKDEVVNELLDMEYWLENQSILEDISTDYRLKSQSSIKRKFDRYAESERRMSEVFNDILGFRILTDSYEPIFKIHEPLFRVVDMSRGKVHDDGYRGVHLYFQLNSTYFPIEIQVNTLYDRQINNWLHSYLYKKDYPESVGQVMRAEYEKGNIKTQKEFEEVLHNVLPCSKT